MIQAIQLVALLQGIFLLIVLYKNKKKYNPSNFFYLNATLISLLFFLVTDENQHLVISHHDVFLIDNTLFITFLLLFVKNFNSSSEIRFFRLLPYFIPVFIYACIELYEILYRETYQIEIIEHFLYFVFAVYLAVAFFYTLKLKAPWTVKIPFFVLIISLFKDYGYGIFSFLTFGVETVEDFNSFLIFEIAAVFYYLTYLFLINSNFINIQADSSKYKNSSLNNSDIESYKKRIIDAMETDKVFTNENLSLQTFSEIVNIPKHNISEILNMHLNTNFQDFVNEYRVEEFIKLYTDPENDHFSILGLATSVGFKNKATFNSNFKKIKGVSPTEYKLHN